MTDITSRIGNRGGLTDAHVENWPINHATCGVDGCSEKTDQAIAVVKKGGRRLAGRFSEFGRWKTANGECVDLILFPQYEWMHWITRCTKHFQGEVNAYIKQKEREHE